MQDGRDDLPVVLSLRCRPQRALPPVASSGLSELTREAAEDLKGAAGVYDSSLGARSNEPSCKVIPACQQQGDVGPFVYNVNVIFAVRYTRQMVCSLIPHIYQTARTRRIIGEIGKIDLVQINQPQSFSEDDVAMEMGPSCIIQREAA